jgi:hypothetical protein
MKIEKLMSIQRFLERCKIEYTRESDEKLEKMVSKNISESIRKSQFEPVRNPLGFPSFAADILGRGFSYGTRGEFVDSFYMWFYKGYVYGPSDVMKRNYIGLQRDALADEQISLLILELYDNERKKFERLKNLYSASPDEHGGYERPNIPEKTRIEVWRRDEGKCVQCGSKERLEYDHIIPISKGGSNTARNIQLLCEKCNRSKGANVA